MAKRTIKAVRVCAESRETAVILDNGDELYGVISASAEVSTDTAPVAVLNMAMISAPPMEAKDG